MKKIFLKILLVGLFWAIPAALYAATFYVDGQLNANCTTGNYSIANRACTGTDGKAYITPSAAISAASSGDTISIREGTYSSETGYNLNFDSGTTIVEGYLNENPVLYVNNYVALFDVDNSNGSIIFRNMKLYSIIDLSQRTSGQWNLVAGNTYTYQYSVATNIINIEGRCPSGVVFEKRNGTYYALSSQLSVANVEAHAGSSFIDEANHILYVHPTGNGNPNINGYEYSPDQDYDAVGIYGTAGGLVTVDNVEIYRFAMVGIKVASRLWVKNSYIYDIGNDGNDHAVYSVRAGTSGNESIIEHNHFKNISGYGIHLYTGGPPYPAYFIVRYNIIEHSGVGILFGAAFSKYYGNTIYGNGDGAMFWGTSSHDNEIKNNLFYGNTSRDLDVDCGAGGPFQIPDNNAVSYNLYGSATACAGCGGSCGVGLSWDDTPPNIRNKNNPFVSTSPITWTDFRLSPSSGAINVGVDLGTANQNGLDPNDTVWPPSTIDQNTQGTGWEIGAFAYREATIDMTPPLAPTGVTVS